MFEEYDIIVVGGGHAGCEATIDSANLGSKVLLITSNLDTIGQMSCNPSIGGIAKGQIVREIDALGGYTGIITDLSTIQFRMLNKSKGRSVWSPRAQCDRNLFAHNCRKTLENNNNVDLWQDTVVDIMTDDVPVIFHSHVSELFVGKAHLHYHVDGYPQLAWALPLDETEITTKDVAEDDMIQGFVDAFQSFVAYINVQTRIVINKMVI